MKQAKRYGKMQIAVLFALACLAILFLISHSTPRMAIRAHLFGASPLTAFQAAISENIAEGETVYLLANAPMRYSRFEYRVTKKGFLYFVSDKAMF